MLMSDEDEALPIIENKLEQASKESPEKILNVLSEYYFKQQKASSSSLINIIRLSIIPFCFGPCMRCKTN